MKANLGDAGLAIKSASPGLIMIVLGTFLMVITIMVNHRIEVIDAPAYTRIFFQYNTSNDTDSSNDTGSSNSSPDRPNDESEN